MKDCPTTTYYQHSPRFSRDIITSSATYTARYGCDDNSDSYCEVIHQTIETKLFVGYKKWKLEDSESKWQDQEDVLLWWEPLQRLFFRQFQTNGIGCPLDDFSSFYVNKTRIFLLFSGCFFVLFAR